MNAIANSSPSVRFGGGDRLLRLTVRLDAWLSGVFGVVLLATGGLVGGLLGIPPTMLGAIGAVCLIYAGTLWLVQARPLILAAAGWTVIGANCVWVAASVLLVLLGWLPLTPLGIACVLLQALAVGVLADVQTPRHPPSTRLKSVHSGSLGNGRMDRRRDRAHGARQHSALRTADSESQLTGLELP